jgi:hypothetical protein
LLIIPINWSDFMFDNKISFSMFYNIYFAKIKYGKRLLL